VIRSKGLPTAVLVACVFAIQPAFAAQAKNGARVKVDRGLTESLQSGEATQQVIVTVKDGYRAQIREALEKHGDRGRSDSDNIVWGSALRRGRLF
jgi:low affinity Fe/Cu permease